MGRIGGAPCVRATLTKCDDGLVFSLSHSLKKKKKRTTKRKWIPDSRVHATQLGSDECEQEQSSQLAASFARLLGDAQLRIKKRSTVILVSTAPQVAARALSLLCSARWPMGDGSAAGAATCTSLGTSATDVELRDESWVVARPTKSPLLIFAANGSARYAPNSLFGPPRPPRI